MLVVVLPECDLARPFATLESGGHQTEAPWFRIGSLALWVKYRIARRMPRRLTSKGGPHPDASDDETIAANINALRRVRGRAGSIPMITVMIPSPALNVARLWPGFQAEAGEVIDLRQELRDSAFFMDGVHLNVRGHEIVAERIFSRVRPLLGIQAATGPDLSTGRR
jgi:hypothetical protein